VVQFKPEPEPEPEPENANSRVLARSQPTRARVDKTRMHEFEHERLDVYRITIEYLAASDSIARRAIR
jgi:hypothetical protein